eukprot:CAMPEP_0185345304 /NCGR_PEP_ID=MMETSP1363-20130426/100556_1 /TAXON_ID=38817 /ORGANISM="Gephyrocapsa oceanica, Strain RCC1303" /LENGTH=197 /DNA_ID=CAMNT_0027944531 /DNA_START=221 /DNA_END=812 /DNA_ORIENTATION=+
MPRDGEADRRVDKDLPPLLAPAELSRDAVPCPSWKGRVDRGRQQSSAAEAALVGGKGRQKGLFRTAGREEDLVEVDRGAQRRVRAAWLRRGRRRRAARRPCPRRQPEPAGAVRHHAGDEVLPAAGIGEDGPDRVEASLVVVHRAGARLDQLPVEGVVLRREAPQLARAVTPAEGVAQVSDAASMPGRTQSMFDAWST